MLRYSQFLLLFYLLLTSCQQQNLNPAFYYWKSVFRLSAVEKSTLEKQKIKRLYVKYFDVSLNAESRPVPIALLRTNEAPPQHIEIVPTVFIVNRVFQAMRKDQYKAQSEQLAKNVWHEIQQINGTFASEMQPITEIQIDCDWTYGSKEAYFHFLKAFKKESSKKISVTVRLYQYKNRKESGIPPADRGMMMLYNLTNPRKFADRNSIFEKDEAMKYVKGQSKYPIPMDVVLPIFSWGVAFHNEDFAALFNDFSSKEADSLPFLKKEKESLYVSRADTVFRNIYLRQGDHIRIEEISDQALQEASEIAQSILNNAQSTIALYHLDENTLKRYSNENLEKALRLRF